MARADDLKKRMGKLWKSTVEQFEGVRDNVKAEVGRVRGERDKLFAHLGEQTLEWVNKSPVRLPAVLQSTVDRLNEVIHKASPKAAKATVEKAVASVKTEAKKAPAKKASTKKATATTKTVSKKAVKKISAKPAKLEAQAPNKAPVSRKPLAVD